MRRLVEFKLSMPSNNSWSGRWSGDGRNHVLRRDLSEDDLARLQLGDGEERGWTYAFGDGWVARVTARCVRADETEKPSDGFCGYDWMVQSILLHGEILDDVQIRARRASAV